MSRLILGGGISGLSTAFYLTKSGIDKIKLYEASNRIGGWISSSKQKNGTLFEKGPRTFKCAGTAAENSLELVKELGLKSSILPIPKTSEVSKNRLIYVNNQLFALPFSSSALFKIDPPFIKPFMYALWQDIRTPKKITEDDSIYDFVARRFGVDYAEILVSALVCGVFAGDAREISVKALLNPLFQQEQEYGGLCRAIFASMFKKRKKTETEKNLPVVSEESKMWSAWALKNGLETLPNQIHNYIKNKNVEVVLGKKCTKIAFEKGKAIITSDGVTEEADHLYSSLPSKNLAEILEDKHSVLKTELSSIPFVTVGVVNLEYEGDLLKKKGFGFLVPPNQNLPILGVIYDSCINPQDGKTVLTVMMGGRWFDKYFGKNANEQLLLKTAEDHVKKILDIHEKPSNCLVSILKDCIPQYIVGHSKRVERIRDYITKNKLPLTLVGNSFDGVGVNDAIFSAKVNVLKSLENAQL